MRLKFNDVSEIKKLLRLEICLGEYLVPNVSGLLIACRFSVEKNGNGTILTVFCKLTDDSFKEEFERGIPLSNDDFFIAGIIKAIKYWKGIAVKVLVSDVGVKRIEGGLTLDFKDDETWKDYCCYVRKKGKRL